MGDFVRSYHNVDINIAMAAESGLVTPLVEGVDKLGLAEISGAVKAMAVKANDGKLTPADMAVSAVGLQRCRNVPFGHQHLLSASEPPPPAVARRRGAAGPN